MTIKVTYNVTDVYMSQSVSPVYINVSYSDGGSSGGGVWGSITGTLSNQTDLQTALDLKLDESTIDGGTEGQILSKASATDFDFAWINNYAKYLATNVRNQTGSTINAFQVVYISGATGNKPLISLADADTEATSSKTYGVTATSIANNGTGDVVTAGELSGIDTSAFNEGDLLWLSTTAGGVITTPPAEPAHAVFIGYVVRSHPTLGVIDVSIQNGYELNELHGVQITTPTDNQGLFYNSTSTLWENKSIATALGYTPVPTTRNITINGVTYDLSADRTYTIATGISGSGAAGQVTYWTGASAVSGSNNLFWESTNGRLDVYSSNPPSIRVISAVNNTYNTAYNTNSLNFSGSGQTFSIQNNSTSIARFHSTNNFTLGTTSDLGTRLGVVGDTLLRGSGNTSATTALTVQNSDGTNLIRFRNDGTTLLGNSGTGLLFGAMSKGDATSFNNNGDGILFSLRGSGDGTDISLRGSNITATTGSATYIAISRPFAPTSGTATYTSLLLNPTINQTGGANGITRGLYVNPTLTSAADWRSIEWSNNSGWGLYGAGTANNYLAGSLGIGTTATGNYNLRVTKNLTGAAIFFNVLSSGAIQSDVTTQAHYFRTGASSANATFTLPNLYHYTALQDSFGVSSTITNQYGFNADSSLTGATNNYGFYGNIASGTGRWNLYMNGTADNYLAGNLGIGITPTVKLHVSGDTILKGSGNTSASNALLVYNSDSNLLMSFNNAGSFSFGPNGQRSYISITDALGTLGSQTLTLQSNLTISNTRVSTQSLINGSLFITRDGIETTTVGTPTNLLIIGHRATDGFAPTSGTALFTAQRISPIINQTGGANGITRGLYVNPTLTSAADFRAIEVSAGVTVLAPSVTARASLRIPSGTAPTSPNDGDIWFDGTDIKMRIGGVTKTFTLL